MATTTAYTDQVLRCGKCRLPHLVSVDVAQNARMFQARDGVDWTCLDCTVGTAFGCHANLETRDRATLVGFERAALHAEDACANDNWRAWSNGVAYRGAARGELVPTISGSEIV